MRRLEHDGRRNAGLERLLPACGDDAPAVARLQPREEPLRLGRGQVVPDRRRELEELVRHDCADRVEARVATLRATVAVPEEAGQRVERARLEVAAEDIHPQKTRAKASYDHPVIHLRVIAPQELAYATHRALLEHPSAVNVVRIRDVAEKPGGDLFLCDVAREDASVVVGDLRALGLGPSGSIALEPISALVSDEARRAEEAAVGSPADAVVWESVEQQTSESAELSLSFVGFMLLATMIAALGIIQDSIILIIGAMVVGAEFGPLAGLSVALVQRQRTLAGRSLKALAVGFPAGIGAAYLLTLALRAFGSAPDELVEMARPATLFISHPDEYSILIALLAGTAGALSLSTSKSGALVGVLISVTTIPAAGNVGVAAAYGDWTEVRGAATQLAVNLTCIVVAIVATLTLQRRVYGRRRSRLTPSR
jgi:uncharacterized hydrophobic protein (TIGR00271 family)